MSFDLLKVQPSALFGSEAVPAVNLRDLHQALGSSQQFTDWAKNRIRETQADEGADYLLHKFMKQLPSGSKHVTDYTVTLDLAKEIAMLERNEKGKQIRRYFIHVEKEFRKAIVPPEVAWVLGQIARTIPWARVLELLVPLHSYGSLAANGQPRTGFRRPAFVAAPHRTAAATDFQEHTVLVKLLARQQELPLTEGGAHG